MRTHGAFILARYSTDRQNPDSIEVQVEKCTKWCNSNGIPILGVFADMAVSGMKDTRPQYNLMMQQLRQNIADTVVIYDQSRMFRKMTAWFAFRDELSAMGVSVVSVTQPMIGKDLRDPTNFLTEGSMALFNQIWALQTRQKVMEKMRFMANNGLHTGGTPPLGYQVSDGHLIVCETEAATVRRIFKEYAAGRTYREIIAGLNADGLTTRSGRSFGTNSLHDLLKNEKYIGTLVYGKAPRKADGTRNSHGQQPSDCIRLENAIPAIIEKEVWERVQIKMKKNQRDKAGRPNSVRDYPLRGKVYCAECGSAMIHSGSKSHVGRYHYYACSGKQRLHNCEMMPIRMADLERTVADAVKTVLQEPGNIPMMLQILRDERNLQHSGAADHLQTLVSRRTEISRQLESCANAIMQGLNSPTLTQKMHELENEKITIEQEMRRLKKNMDASAFSDERMMEILQAVLKADDLAAILSIVCRVEVGREFITIWTILDTDHDGDALKDTSLLPESRFIPIPGSGSPAPQKSETVDTNGFGLLYFS